MKIKGVSIGDKFKRADRKDKAICIVVDIYTITNSNGEIVEYKCIAEQPFLNQMIRFETPFTTVIKHKIV
jgi:hypothetical protein